LGDAEATYALAELILRRNWEQALTVFERILRQNPMSQAALRGYALWLMANARFADAFKKIDRALVVSRKSFLNIGIMCMVLYASGADLNSLVPAPSAERPEHDSRRLVYDFMMRVTEEQSELKVDAAWYILGLFYERAGWHERAIKAIHEVKLADEKFLGLLVLAYNHAVAGQAETARQLLDKLKALERWVSPFHFALIELALGNREEAKWYLDDAIAKCDPWACLLIDPRLKDLRDDPEFLDMFRRINLDPNLLRTVS
jgi:tetratricopeptide (TPR) repeat protein